MVQLISRPAAAPRRCVAGHVYGLLVVLGSLAAGAQAQQSSGAPASPSVAPNATPNPHAIAGYTGAGSRSLAPATYADIENTLADDPSASRLDMHCAANGKPPLPPAASASNSSWTITAVCDSKNNPTAVQVNQADGKSFQLGSVSFASLHAALLALPNCDIPGSDWSQVLRDGQCAAPADAPPRLQLPAVSTVNPGTDSKSFAIHYKNNIAGLLNLVAFNNNGGDMPTAAFSDTGVPGTLVAAQNDGAGGPNGRHSIAVYAFPNAPLGAVTYKAVYSSPQSRNSATVFSFSGAANGRPVESAASSFAAPNAKGVSCGTVTTTGTNEVIMVLGIMPYSVFSTTPSYIPVPGAAFGNVYHSGPIPSPTAISITMNDQNDSQLCIAFAVRHR